MVDYKMENGVRLPLTVEEQAEHDALAAALPAYQVAQKAIVNVPDLATQILTLLVAKNVVTTDDIAGHLTPDVLETVNGKLEAAGAMAITAETVSLKVGG